ncbi:hypothetical protein K474DRAFT_1701955 [Panus rudis PR-1116 ss-1]|nr:hypothetical protein K474DRAFT_1701955 [Panus rudis PR-1116 ss-1]
MAPSHPPHEMQRLLAICTKMLANAPVVTENGKTFLKCPYFDEDTNEECRLKAQKKQKTNLWDHIKTHFNIRDRGCDFCDDYFTNASSKTRHMIVQHDYKPGKRGSRKQALPRRGSDATTVDHAFEHGAHPYANAHARHVQHSTVDLHVENHFVYPVNDQATHPKYTYATQLPIWSPVYFNATAPLTITGRASTTFGHSGFGGNVVASRDYGGYNGVLYYYSRLNKGWQS